MFTRGRGSKLSDAELAKLRVTQLQQFTKLNPSAHPINADSTAFELPIHTQYGRLTLYVHFPANFPACPPVVQLTSLIAHPYVDTDMYVVNHPKIVHWDPHKSSAGLLLAELVSEWARTPPTPVTLAQVKEREAKEREEKDREAKERDNEWIHVRNSPMSISPVQPPAGQPPVSALSLPAPSGNAASSVNTSSSSSASSSPAAPSAAQLALPIPSTFDFLTSASLSELQTFDADASLLHSHLATLPTWQHMQHIHADMLDTLTEQAALSLQQQPDYARLRREVEDVKRAVNDEVKELELLMRRQQEVISRYSIERTLQQLQRLAEEAEKRSEAMRDRYLEGGDEDAGGAGGAAGGAGGAGVEDGAVMADDEKDVSAARRGDRHSRFAEAYVKQRMAVHERLAKRERLMEWATQRQQYAQ